MVCRALMLRLIQRDASGRSVRRPAQLAPLLADQQRRRVLERLVATRLLALDGETVLVAHEAIATAWPRLDAWLEEDAEGARLVSTVAAAADAWNASDRREEDLLRGARLRTALDWRRTAGPDLTTIEHEFLDAAAERERDEVRESAERAARDKRNNRRLRWALAGAGLLLVVAIAAGGLAAVRGQEAGVAADNARVEALVATSLSLLDNDRETAALLAAEAFRRWPDDARVRSALWGVMTSTGGIVDTHHTENGFLASFAMVPGSGTALRVASHETAPDEPIVDLIDVATGEVVHTFDLDLPVSVTDVVIEEHARALIGAPPVSAVDGWTVEVSDDGRTAAILTFLHPDPLALELCCWTHLTLFDLTTGRLLPGTGLLRTETSDTMVFDELGRTLYLAQATTADLIAVNVATGEVRASSAAALDAPVRTGPFFDALAIVDESLIAVGAGNHVRLYDRATLSLRRDIPFAGDVASYDIVVDARGGFVATGSEGTVRALLSTGEVLWRRSPNSARNCNNLYLATESAVACGSYQEMSLLDLSSGETIGSPVALQLNRLPFFDRIDDESLLVSVPIPPLWMRWRVDGGSAGSKVVAKSRLLVAGPEPGGSLVVTTPKDGGPMQLWDIEQDAAFGEESDRIVPLGSGVVARYARYDGSMAPQAGADRHRRPDSTPHPGCAGLLRRRARCDRHGRVRVVAGWRRGVRSVHRRAARSTDGAGRRTLRPRE